VGRAIESHLGLTNEYKKESLSNLSLGLKHKDGGGGIDAHSKKTVVPSEPKAKV
jgi:hypothetical protein